MSMQRLRYLCIGLFVLLQGCLFPGMHSINPDKPIALLPNTGLIVGSVTAPKVMHYWEISHFRYRHLEQSTAGVLESASPTANLLWMKDRPIEPGGTGPDAGLEQQLGRLFAIELPAGRYEIYGLDTPGLLLFQMPPLLFEVRAGEILYLGNLHVRYCLYTPNHSRAYRGYINGGIPSIDDQAERDIPLLLRKFPALQDVSIIPAVINDRAWQELGIKGLPRLETRC